MDNELTENHDPIKHTTLRKLMKENAPNGLNVEGDLEHVMKGHLENAFQEIWKVSIEKTKQRDGHKIREEDLRAALNEIFNPYTTMEEVVTMMDEYHMELNKKANEFPLINMETSEDE
ncbi:hypothetical protein [Haloferax volcanii]|uniref:hypothetical protein n=1 Tax=Haloferax volcanii TaxID=2246 RepID=UPI003D302037